MLLQYSSLKDYAAVLNYQLPASGAFKIMHQSIPPAPSHPPPPGPPCQSLGWGICKCCTARGPGICQSPGQSRAFDTHAVFYQNITTKKVLLEEKQIGSFVKDRNKLQRVVMACSRFYMYVCIFSLLIKPESQRNQSYRCESTFFGY